MPGCTLEAERYRDRCSEHLRQREEIAELLRRFAPVVKKACMAYEISGLDEDDVQQVGMLALWEAAKRYKLGRDVPFGRFLALVLELRMRDAGAKSRRLKNRIVDQSVRILITEDGGEMDVFEIVPDPTAEPWRIAQAHEDLSHIIHVMNSVLTEAERLAIQGVLNDLSYDEIAKKIHGDRRAVDNAVQRARRKLRTA